MTKQSASAKARKKPKAQAVDGGGTADGAVTAAGGSVVGGVADGTVGAAGTAGADAGAAVRIPAQKGKAGGAAESSSGSRGAAEGSSGSRGAAKNSGGAGQAGAGLPGSTRQALGGWLEGPNLHDGEAGGYRGERLGLPESGSGALAGQGRRLGALLVDWLIAYLITKAIGWNPSSSQGAWGVLAVFAAEHLLLVSLLGYTIGKRIFGMRIGRLGGPLSPMAVVIRTLLLLVVIPAAVWDRDGRGLHDRIAGTVEVLR